MHVLYFHQHFSTPQGSSGTRSYEMALALLRAGHRVTMVCGSYMLGQTGLSGPFVKGVRRGQVDGIDVIQIELSYSNYQSFIKRSLVFLRFALAGIRIALSEPYDLIFATSTPLTAGIPGIFARLLRRKPFVFEVRDLWPELPREMGVIKNPVVLGLMSFLEWISYYFAGSCIALSPGIAEGIKKRSRPGLPVAMVPNGCDLDLFQPARRSKLEVSGIGESDLVALFTGAHGIANGLDAVLDAARVLKQKGVSNIKLLFIGDGKLKPQLQEQALREGLDNCIFLPPVKKTEISCITASADVGMQILANIPAFYYGTSPNKFFDYLASGIPVLNNYPGWLADLINENDCGIAVPPENPEAFADALIQFRDDRERRLEQGRNARKLAESQFSREKLAREFVAALERGRAVKFPRC